MKLITLATLSPDSPLGLVWKHAFREGLKEGFRRGVELSKDKDVKQAFWEGANEGRVVGILAEREEWEAGLVATIYIMYSQQLPWGILISYRK